MKNNPVFWLMWLLPGAAVCASFATLAIALEGADTKLPASYHWEGPALDEDFGRARRAAELRIGAVLEIRPASRECVVTVDGAASESLRLLFTHSNDVDLDRQVLLKRAPGGEFRAACEPLDAGKWRIALDDETQGWSLRARSEGAPTRLELRARHPEGAAT